MLAEWESKVPKIQRHKSRPTWNVRLVLYEFILPDQAVFLRSDEELHFEVFPKIGQSRMFRSLASLY